MVYSLFAGISGTVELDDSSRTCVVTVLATEVESLSPSGDPERVVGTLEVGVPARDPANVGRGTSPRGSAK